MYDSLFLEQDIIERLPVPAEVQSKLNEKEFQSKNFDCLFDYIELTLYAGITIKRFKYAEAPVLVTRFNIPYRYLVRIDYEQRKTYSGIFCFYTNIDKEFLEFEATYKEGVLVDIDQIKDCWLGY